MPFVTPIVAGLLALLYLFLSVRVIRLRGQERISLSDAGNAEMQRRIRVHGNFAEYTPFALVLLLLLELQGAPWWYLAVLGLMLLAGRSLHAYGVSQNPEPLQLRIAGMAMTFAVLALGGLSCIILALMNRPVLT
ncbi:membrane protein [Roseibium aquae]|uniref:Membrane protein n=1 Tax=Roseibium aquae TaxID=1323746 RepID=A0A916TLL7_9HYPH|nr:MAPEG family protein [Roseibium aquae]GGB53498.1 membrane protein [Roseibium aquae]